MDVARPRPPSTRSVKISSKKATNSARLNLGDWKIVYVSNLQQIFIDYFRHSNITNVYTKLTENTESIDG
jgi:hypothetical protein